MSSRALNKKSFEIKNKTWLKYCSSLTNFIAFSLLVMFIFDFIYGICFLESKVVTTPQAVPMFHLLGFIVLQIYSMFLIRDASEQDTDLKSLARWMGGLAIFTIFYEFNPWISGYYELTESYMFVVFEYSFMLQTIFAPISIIISSFATWILLKMARIQADWDEPYAVICGGKDSTTKRLIGKKE